MIETPLLIIGGHGMLGQDLARVFADLNPTVWDIEDIDITDDAMVRKKFADLKPKTIINAAAYNAVDNAEEHEGFVIAKKVNGDGPAILAKVAVEIDATLVHFSSDYVFDGLKEEGYSEEDEPNPQSGYAKSKLFGEHAVLQSDVRGFVIRTCRLFGQPGASEGSKNSFVDTMLELAKTRNSLDVVDEEVASPTYTLDLAERVRFILDGEYEPGLYHVTNLGACTWYEFAQEIFHQAGIAIALEPVPASTFPRPAARPAFSILLNTKLPPMRTWQEALADHIQQAQK